MPKSKKYLAIDLGASSGRGIVGEFDGNKLRLRENHRFDNIPLSYDGKLFWNIHDLFSNIKLSVGKTVSDGDNIVSLGIDTWGVDYGIVSRNGKLCGDPRHYRDTRTDCIFEYAEGLYPRIVDRIYNTTGIQSMNFNTVFQLLAERRDDPNVFGNGEKILFMPDLLNYFLTGNAVTEYTIASTGAVLDAKTKTYAASLLSSVGISDEIFFGAPVMPGLSLGKLTSKVTDEVGACRAKVLTVASHDTASAVFAVPTRSADFVYISSGTWSLLGTELDSPIINEDTQRYNYTNEGGIGGKIRFLKNIMGLWIIQECRREFARLGRKYTYSEMTSMASAEKPFRFIIDPNDSRFSSPGKMPQRIVDYCRTKGIAAPESDAEIVRCVIDSLALCYRYTVENLARLTGKRPTAINIVGGGTQNKLLSQITADVSGIPVVTGPVEATAIGNILSQLISDGQASDIHEAREIVLNSFETEYFTPRDLPGYKDAYARFFALTD